MLSSISPLGERARHNRWGVTVGFYVAGSALAATAVGAALGAVGSLPPVPGQSRDVVLAALAAVAAVVDATGRRVPGPRRQVDEDWLGRYRGAVYGAGFGAQLGAGVTTIVTSATVWLVLAAELVNGRWWAGAVIGAVFGTVRALPLVVGGRTRTWAALAESQRRMASRAATARTMTVAVTAAAALGWGALAR